MENSHWRKNLAFFMAGQALSLFGSMLVQYAIMWYVTLRAQSGSVMTWFVIAGILPMFFISPFGGVWADRYNRKIIINLADGAIAFTTLIAAICFLLGNDSLPVLFFCAAIRALGQGVQTPAVNALIPQLVPQEYLAKVNGINGSVQSCIFIVAPIASGALMNFASIEILFFIDIITAAIGIGIVFFFVKSPGAVKRPEGETTQKGIDYFRDIKNGIQYIRRHPYLLQLMCISVIFFVAASPSSFLTPLQVTRNFGPDVWRLTAMEIAFSLGMMAGSVLVGWWGGFKNRSHSMALATFLFGIEAIALGFIPRFVPYCIVMGLVGTTMPLYNIPSTVILQTKVEEAYMGRVFGVFGMLSSLMAPAGMLIFGPLADRISIETLLIITGVVIALSGVPFITSKVLREAGIPTEKPKTPLEKTEVSA